MRTTLVFWQGFRTLSRRLGGLTGYGHLLASPCDIRVFVPSRGEWGVLPQNEIIKEITVFKFPYPRGVNGGSYWWQFLLGLWILEFPYPLEVTWGSYEQQFTSINLIGKIFPYPLEETGGSNKKWHELELQIELFPYPLEMNEGFYVKMVLITMLASSTNSRPLPRWMGCLTDFKTNVYAMGWRVSVPSRGDWGVLLHHS